MYLKTDQQYNNRPLYLLDRGGNDLVYDNTGYWTIGYNISGRLTLTLNKQGLLIPPTTGWYYDNGTDYLDMQATSLSLSNSSNIFPEYPAALAMSSGSPGLWTVSPWHSSMGIYLKEDNLHYNNKPVYQLDRGGEFLYYSDIGYWMIGNSINATTIIPPSTEWFYFNGTDYLNINVTVSGEIINQYLTSTIERLGKGV